MAYVKPTTPQYAGDEGAGKMLRWIWDTGFAAVGGDTVSFELFPPRKE